MTKRNKIILFSILFTTLLIFAFRICSQPVYIPGIKFRNLTSKEGLSSNSIQSCLLDSYGFLWIGTQTGLNRYDGKSIKIYDHSDLDTNSIGDGFIWNITEDKENIIWIGTNNGGLNRFDPITEKFDKYEFDPADVNSISSNTVFCIVDDNDNYLWLSTSNGVNRFDKKTHKFTRYLHSDTDSNSISFNDRSTLFKDKGGNIFVGTKYALNKYIKSSNNFRRIKLHQDNDFEIMCISQDNSGVFWMGTHRRGIFKYNEATGAIENLMPVPGNVNSLASNAIRAIVHCDNGLIWIAHVTEKAGLDIYDTKSNTFYNFKNDKSDINSIGRDVIWDIYKDRNNNMWICTNGGGLGLYSEYTTKFNHINKLKSYDKVRDLRIVWDILYAYDRFWCYTDGVILSFSKYGDFIKEYNPSLTKLKLFTPLLIGKATERFYAGDLEAFLTYYDNSTDNFFKCPIKYKNTEKRFGYAGAIFEDAQGNIWLGTTEKGLVKLDKDFNEVDIFPDNDSFKNAVCKSWSNSIYQDSENYLWFGGDELTKINLLTGELFNFKTDENSLYNPAGGKLVSSFYEDGKGYMWITYKGSGFDRLDMKKNIFKHYNNTNGLINNYILAALPDNSGNLWLGTAKGLIKFNPETETFTNYDISDGVQDEEFNDECCFRAEDGMLVFGGVNGINWFYPEKIRTNPHIPAIAFTSFKVFNKELNLPQNINFTEEINLTHKENFFLIEFASLDFANPSKNQYKYKLEGIDKDWNYSGINNEANYTDIDAGEYVFKVKGSNNDGVWNEEGKSIKIIITPPWWKKWWVKGLIAILIFGFLFYRIYRRYDKIRIEKNAQEDITRRIIQSNEEERKKISLDLHDSVGQELAILKNIANKTIKELGQEKEVLVNLKKISELSSSVLNNVRTLSHNLRPVELDKLGLTETLKSIIEKISSSSEIKFYADIENIDGILSKNDDVNFCRIIQECLNNILKHSKASGASVLIKVNKSEISTVVKDDGIGFNPEENNKGKSYFGLTGMKERVKILKGRMEIKSALQQGTEIVIIIPIIKK